MSLETKDSLAPDEREIVALGASVGSGCQPCVTHHVRASREAGLNSEQIVAIVLRAHDVAVIAADRIAREGVSLAGTTECGRVTSPASQRASELAALGAAIAANSMPDIEVHLAGATGEGLTRDQLAQAVSVAQDVQRSAASIHARKTARLLDLAAVDESRAGQAHGDVASATTPGEASDEGHGAHDAASRQPDAAADGRPTTDEGADDCGCHEDRASAPGRESHEQSAKGMPCDPSRMADWGSGGWASMMTMMGVDPARFSDCCVPPKSHEADGRAADSAEPACDCASAPWTRDAMRAMHHGRTEQ